VLAMLSEGAVRAVLLSVIVVAGTVGEDEDEDEVSLSMFVTLNLPFLLDVSMV
jgi:hypothetical protein